MGGDKASLSIDGEPLARRQLRVLREAGVTDVRISLAPGTSSPLGDLPVVRDPGPDMGPLAGIVAGLEAVAPHSLLVLAVDMGRVTPSFLRDLVTRGSAGTGLAPRVGGRWEPLCAIYPTRALSLARRVLDGPHPSPSALLDELEEGGLLEVLTLKQEEAGILESWNRPEDLPDGVIPPASGSSSTEIGGKL